jgi:hypothetical protein
MRVFACSLGTLRQHLGWTILSLNDFNGGFDLPHPAAFFCLGYPHISNSESQLNPRIVTVASVRRCERWEDLSEVSIPTSILASFVLEMRKRFERPKMIGPDAVFPLVYFVIRRHNSGRTDSDRGLIVDAEMFADTGRGFTLAGSCCIAISPTDLNNTRRGNDLATQL